MKERQIPKNTLAKAPSASLYYPIGYNINLNLDQLDCITKTHFWTHRNWLGKATHKLGQLFKIPLEKSLEFLVLTKEWNPWIHKDDKGFLSKSNYYLKSLFYYTVTPFIQASLFLSLIPFVGIAFFGFVLDALSHWNRPIVSRTTNYSIKKSALKSCEEISILSLNIASMPHAFLKRVNGTYKNKVSDIADFIINDKKHQPDIVFFQEAFDENDSTILTDKLKTNYCDIISQVAPNILGLNSGLMVASKYPIISTSIHRLRSLMEADAAADKMIHQVVVQTEHGPVHFYNTHLQSRIGNKYAKARADNLTQLHEIMMADKHAAENRGEIYRGVVTVDSNSSRINILEQENKISEAKNHENIVLELRDKTYFDNPFYNDHDEKGNRTSGESSYTKDDNMRLPGMPDLPEPTASFYKKYIKNPELYPNNEPKPISQKVLHDAKKDAKQNAYTLNVVSGDKKCNSDWDLDTGAVLDHILIYKDKNSGEQCTLTGTAEIRRIPGTDHAGMQARLRFFKRLETSSQNLADEKLELCRLIVS